MNPLPLSRNIPALLSICSILVASNIYTLIPIYGTIAEDLGISRSSVIWAGSLFTFFYACGLLSIGPISDYTGRKKILVLGLLASALSSLAVALSTDVFSLWLTRSIQGFTLASFASVIFSYSFELFPFKQRTLLVVLINTGFLIAGIFGQLASSFLSEWLSWNSVFIFFALCYSLLAALTYWLLPESPGLHGKQEKLWRTFRSILHDPNLGKCYMIAFTLLFSIIAFYDALGRFFTGPGSELYMIRVAGLAGASVSLFTGKLIEKAGELRTLSFGLVLGVIGLLSMLIFHSTLGLIVFSIMFISSISLAIPTVITLIGELAGTRRAKALSLYSFILLSGASLAPAIVSLFHFFHMLILLSVIFMANLGLCAVLFKTKSEGHFQ
ncbi:MFS transporter [Mesobacillus foraminis]|uniref:Putative MFS family arabinose efflux permease n=1 Tax=Mesobacillus foraminis TaxID=279826 RepID=A0A4V2REA4_9BACI|nr:MFS transporter [Mesobacillus foraminis]TCN27940.1 putative MFS family arabinose efflux permease [Mesobacillus foraminis]